ncbi:unnamed protein product [Cuscuta epithymum]|uniref:Uncharacterized protein n=1 Tax=Cuscuta epithymum TaxID=186058 RepID=A0AAV0D0Z3_9ASTE|nr:unnamed protein product [Cuscuta epithymum]
MKLHFVSKLLVLPSSFLYLTFHHVSYLHVGVDSGRAAQPGTGPARLLFGPARGPVGPSVRFGPARVMGGPGSGPALGEPARPGLARNRNRPPAVRARGPFFWPEARPGPGPNRPGSTPTYMSKSLNIFYF